ncbi:MAG TPA: hypothetical protein RMF84_09655, partial [Polyangiaceae bacterium LLY-WYZ-14_1]|nr:hypothetical protein [Polyangiaceae bacterium LLY-WYZ-14_1]
GRGATHQVYPVVDLAVDSVAIDAVAPLEPGTLLDPIEVVGRRHVVRIASAVVREALPWVTARGEPRFRCRLALGRPGLAPEEAAGDLLVDPRGVRRALELASMMQAPLRVVSPTAVSSPPTGTGLRLVGALRDRLRLGADGPELAAGLRERRAVRVTFDLFAVSYEMDVRVLEAGAGAGAPLRATTTPPSIGVIDLEVAFPLVLRRRRRRRRPRVVLPEGVHLDVRNTATGERVAHPVLDASFGGFCLASDPARDLLWPDLPLEEAELCWGDRRAALGDLRVRSVDPDLAASSLDAAPRERCHVELRAKERASDDPLLIDLLATFGHPELEVHTGEGFPEIVGTYDEAQLLAGYMKDNLRPVAPAAAVHWRRLHQAPGHLVRTLVHRDAQGRPDATISSLRAWDRTWLIQHFGATSADGFRWSGELQEATLDWIIPRTDGDYMLFFVHAANRRMNAFYQRFIELTGTPEAIAQSGIRLFRLPAKEAASPAGIRGDAPGESGVRPRGTAGRPSQGERRLVARSAEARFGTMAADALGFRPDELELPRCAEAFAAAELVRRRRPEVVRVGRRARAALLHEDLSVGLNLTWMQNASWVLPLGGRPELDPEAMPAVVDALLRRPAPSPAGDRFALLPEGVSGEGLEREGWLHLLDARVYVLNRAGLHRYYHYVTDRYGEVGIRKASRSAAAAQRAGSAPPGTMTTSTGSSSPGAGADAGRQAAG